MSGNHTDTAISFPDTFIFPHLSYLTLHILQCAQAHRWDNERWLLTEIAAVCAQAIVSYSAQSLPRVSWPFGVTAAHQVSADTEMLTGRALPSPRPIMMFEECPELGRYKLHCFCVG